MCISFQIYLMYYCSITSISSQLDKKLTTGEFVKFSKFVLCFFQVVCNALWYVRNHYNTINEWASHEGICTEIPEAFSKYQGYDDSKRKKVKQHQLSLPLLTAHSVALYNICEKGIMKISPEWKRAHGDFVELANCINSFRNCPFINEKQSYKW